MKFLVKISIAAMISIGVITCLALCMGHDSVLVTGATSGIVGIVAGVAAYYKGKSAGSKDANKE